MKEALEVLHKYWSYTSFKKPQEAIINHVLANQNVVALLPTGGGKSICYQIPGLLKEGVCIVISPLIALMHDQVDSLKKKGIKAIAITAALRQNEVIEAFDNLMYGNYKFLYLSPEKLQSKFIQEKIKQLQVNLVAIDEAHCISEWGHDFRPAYLKIPILNEIHPNTPVIALTATATKQVLNDIVTQLTISDAHIVKQSLIRKNLALNIIHSEDFYYHIKRIMGTSPPPSIIYANSRKKVKNVSDYLNKNGFKSTYYHGGLSAEKKEATFADWMTEKTPIMVATNAFGMGIDKNNVRYILHLDIPFSLENYMQEAGRAGRDGQDAFSYIFVNPHTLSYIKELHTKNTISVELANKVYLDLNQYFQIAYGELPQQSFEFQINDFCTHYHRNILQTYNTIKLLERESILIFDERFRKQSTLKFTVAPDIILAYSTKNNSGIIKTVLRSYGGIFEYQTHIDEFLIAKKTGTTAAIVKNELMLLANHGLATYRFKNNTGSIQFLVPREDTITIRNIAANIQRQHKVKASKVAAIMAYAQNENICRSRYLLDYFGEKNSKDCGICDVCKPAVSSDYHQLALDILHLFSGKKTLSTKEVVSNFNIESAIVLKAIQILLDTNKITITSQNKLEKVLK
ncbi:MAG TPA: RecQ family ATP-dependent DNA helicase [Flavobacteriia bacterium]|nr:RecQ family ATP-dependent DNA helicase [Flavobacteriia bacterium]